MGVNVLFTCAGRRNYLINYFKQALSGNGITVAIDGDFSAPALVEADVAEIVPNIFSEDYIDVLLKIIEKHNISCIISLNDHELPILAENKEKLEASGAKVIISNKKVIDVSFDKIKTVEFLESIGLKSPKTYTNLDDAITAINEGKISLPVVLKPKQGSASIGISFPESVKELRLEYELLELKLSREKLFNRYADIIIQEKLEGEEYGMDILNDFDGSYVNTFVRKKVSMRAGETEKAISVVDERFEAVGKTIGSQLGHIGNLDCDVFLVGDDIFVLELNPRFGGGYPFSHEAGIDTASIYVSWLMGQKNIERFMNYRPGVFVSKCDKLIHIKQ